MATITRDPNLLWNPLSEAESQSLIVPTQWIVHTAVDGRGPTNLHGYFERHTNLESHTWLRWDRHEQLMSFARKADANYKANRFRGRDGVYRGAISTETEDDGSPVENPWNQYQLDELIRFGVWLHYTFGIPAVLCPGPWEPGMGWHAMWGAPSAWTNVRGKTCPGSTRIHQFKTIVLPAIQFVIANENKESDFMAINTHEARVAFVKDAYEDIAGRTPKQGEIDFWVWGIGNDPTLALALHSDLVKELRKKISR